MVDRADYDHVANIIATVSLPIHLKSVVANLVLFFSIISLM